MTPGELSLLRSYAGGPRIWDAASLEPVVCSLEEKSLIEPVPGCGPLRRLTDQGRWVLSAAGEQEEGELTLTGGRGETLTITRNDFWPQQPGKPQLAAWMRGGELVARVNGPRGHGYYMFAVTLGELLRFCRAVLGQQEQEVHVLVVSQPHGNQIGAYSGYDAAHGELAAWVRSHWDHVAGAFLAGGHAKPESPEGLTDSEAIELYFEDNDDEWYELAAEQVHSAPALREEQDADGRTAQKAANGQ